MPALLHGYRLSKRDYCYQAWDGSIICRDSAWDNWVRWVVLAIIIVGFFILFVLCSCISARRRRRVGQNPFWGTGWAARQHGAPAYSQNAQWPQNPQYNYYNSQPAPPYGAPSQGYFGPQQSGIELQAQPQSPPPAFHGASGQPVYTPPAGPPPTKGDGIIR